MTLQQLNFLSAVVEQGSINQAAQTMFVAPSSISNAIRDLEDEIGIAIFFRHNKGMSLTKEGQAFYDQIKPMLEQEEKILEQYSSSGGNAVNRLDVSALHFPFLSQALVKLIDSLGDEGYNIRIKEYNIQHIINDVDSEQSDIGLFFMSSSSEDFLQKLLKERNLTFRTLATTRPHAFLRKGHPLADKDNLHISEFEQYPYLILDLEYSSSEYSEEIILKGFKKPEKVINLTDRGTLYSVLRHTDGYSIGSGLLPTEHSDEHITSVAITYPAETMKIGYISRARRKLNPLSEKFVEIVEKCLKGSGL